MTRLLLDTNALLWSLNGSPRIDAVKDLILSDESQIFVSAVSWWEIAIKIGIGKLKADLEELRVFSKESGFLELALSGVHAQVLTTLEPLHNDPFDRMLVSQALSEPMRLISGDSLLAGYSSLVIVI
ncbi:twitching motility protein PilT [Spirochaetia bacterium]|nr:twitching motility protein PilT [Spirochaetia bacterium]